LALKRRRRVCGEEVEVARYAFLCMKSA